MKLLDLLNYVIVAVVLLAIGWVIKSADLVSFYSIRVIPNICSVMALALMVAALAGVVLQKPVSEIPRATGAVISAVFILLAFGLIFANAWKNLGSQLFYISLAEWLGASLMMLLVFFMPRLKKQ